MSFEEIIDRLVSLFPSPLRGPAQYVANVFLTLWHTVTDFWSRVRQSWQTLRAAAWGRILAQLRHAYALAVTLRWLITVYVPRQASLFAQAVRDEARQLYAQAVATAKADLGAARDFFVHGLDQLADVLTQWAHWVSDHVHALEDDGKRLKDRVFGTLGSPERLAQWAIGAIMAAAVNFLLDNAVPIGRRLVAQRTQLFLDGLDKAEDIVTRIL